MSRQFLSLAAVAALLPSAWSAVVDLPVHFYNTYVSFNRLSMLRHSGSAVARTGASGSLHRNPCQNIYASF